MLRVIAFKLEDSLLQKVDMHAQRLGITRSELIRKALYAYVSRLEREVMVSKNVPTIGKRVKG